MLDPLGIGYSGFYMGPFWGLTVQTTSLCDPAKPPNAAILG